MANGSKSHGKQVLRLIGPANIEVEQPGRACEHCGGIGFVAINVT